MITPDRTPARQVLVIGTPSNMDNGKAADNQRGFHVLQNVREVIKRHNIPRTKEICLDYHNAQEQIRDVLHNLGLTETKIIVVAGDGSTTVALAAILKLQDELMQSFPLLIPGGGLENLLAKQLNTKAQSSWKKFLLGENSYLRTLKMRQLVVQDEQAKIHLDAPWINFAGEGGVGRLLHHYEPLTRRNYVYQNVLKALQDAVPQALRDKYKPNEFAGVAQPNYGSPVDLGPQNDCLSSDEFSILDISANNALDAVLRFALLSAGTRSFLRDTLLYTDLPPWLAVVPGGEMLGREIMTIRPLRKKVHTFQKKVNVGDRLWLHVDGSPTSITAPQSGIMNITMSTKPGILTVCTAR